VRRAPIVITATIVATTAVLMFRPREQILAVNNTAAASQATVDQSGDATVATGGPIASQFGTTQVTATISGGKITDVQAIKINSNEPRSIQISNDAIPTLREEVLAQQTAAVDMVSGATVTSQAYTASLQSALDKAGFQAADGSTASTTPPTADAGRGGHRGFGR
jgi:uncharacterized protein with FMN-binding domain